MLGFGNRKQPRNFNEQITPYGTAAQDINAYGEYAGGNSAQPMPQNRQMQNAAQPMPQTAQQNDPRTEEYINMKVAEIDAQVREFSQKNPNFDMRREIQNPIFCGYVWKNGLSVEDAYYLVHRNNDAAAARGTGYLPYNIPGAGYTAQKRISENGTGRTAGSGMIKKNPKDLSDEEVDDIVKRVRNGEKISF